MIKNLFRRILRIIKGIEVFALVGKSGTGKSFRAKLVAQKYGIELIIDDGLVICGNKIIAGKTAKKAKGFLEAVRTAIFEDSNHRKEAIHALADVHFQRVLILGTSERMVRRIAEHLSLPPITKIIHIEEIAEVSEIEKAILSRNKGKHIIPVPAIEIKQNYPHLFYDTIKVFFKSFGFNKKTEEYEKTIVRPDYEKRGRISISEAALTQMVIHCVDEFNAEFRIKKVVVVNTGHDYRLKVFLVLPFGVSLFSQTIDLQNYIIDSIEKFTGANISRVDIEVNALRNR